MNTCQSCGHTPCTCAPAVLSGIQLVNSLLSNPTIDGMTANGGTATSLALVGAQLDCTSRGCTAGAGVCNDGVATNAQVCAQVSAAISSSNAAFCDAVASCIVADPTTLCAGVATCISISPGIINSSGAFGIGARATTALYGVARYATIGEFENANCLLAIDPCTLAAFWNAPNLSSAMWAAFSNAVNAAVSVSPAFCTAIFACGAAPLASPALTGTPTAPTAAPGTNNTTIATTAFVQAAVAAAVSCVGIVPLWGAAGGNPGAGVRFLGDDCQRYTAAQVAATGGGGGGVGGVFARGEIVLQPTNDLTPPGFVSGGFYTFFGFPPHNSVQVTFTVPQPDATYSVLITTQGEAIQGQWYDSKTAAGFFLVTNGVGTGQTALNWAAVR